jgi:hypothetical protein
MSSRAEDCARSTALAFFFDQFTKPYMKKHNTDREKVRETSQKTGLGKGLVEVSGEVQSQAAPRCVPVPLYVLCVLPVWCTWRA